ncbi:MAG: ABC transporter permease [Candidatus Brockarchaeota archaeon]|nr:ABC transporter permease [Candidatus Brockarchaeota archaeon]
MADLFGSILNEEIVNVTILSFKISGSAVALATLLALPLGAMLALSDFRGKKLLVTLINTLMGLPPVVVGLVLYLLLSRSGFLGPLELLYTPTAMVLAQFLLALPIVAGLSYSAIAAVPRSVLESTISLGATRGQLLLVLMREARIGILASVVAAFGAAISEVGAIMLVGGNIRFYTRSLTTAIVLYTNMGEFGIAISLGAILLASSFAINLFLAHLQARSKGSGPSKAGG